MRNITGHIGKLEIIRRLPSSKNGNPRFLLRVDGWTCRTAPDSMDGYAVQNMDGRTVVATIGTHYGQTTLDSVRPSHRDSAEREAIRHQRNAAHCAQMARGYRDTFIAEPNNDHARLMANQWAQGAEASSHSARAYLFALINGMQH